MKKKSPDHSAALDKLDFLDSIEEHAAVQWFSHHWQQLLYGFLAAFILLFSLYAWKAKSVSKAEIDYYDAAQIFQSFQAGGDGSQEAFEQLNRLLNRQPDLHAKYDGLIAQTFLDRGQASQAMPFAERTLSRIDKDHLPFYVDFSSISLLLANNQESEGLTQSISLKVKMLDALAKSENVQESPSFGSSLFALNLLRIGMLEQKVGSPSGELAAWKEWQNYANHNSSTQINSLDLRALFTLVNGISEGKATLQDYINLRLEKLQQQ